MKKDLFLRELLLLVVAISIAACSSQKVARSKWNDKNLRVCIDNEIDTNNYARLQLSLMKSEKFVVVDRNSGLRAAVAEQNMERANDSRFDSKERWSLWSRLWGCGSIVVGQSQCHRVQSRWNSTQYRNRCSLFLTLVDANTSEVRASAEAESESEATLDYYSQLAPSWDEAVEKMVQSYPKIFESDSYAESIQVYRGIAEEEAARQREKDAQQSK